MKGPIHIFRPHEAGLWVYIGENHLKMSKHACACGRHESDGGHNDSVARLEAGTPKCEIERCGSAIAHDRMGSPDEPRQRLFKFLDGRPRSKPVATQYLYHGGNIILLN
jgi:hypothetical protein